MSEDVQRLQMFTWREHVQTSELPPMTRYVLVTLSTHMTRWGENCYPSVRQIAYETGLGRSTVIRHLAAAEELGWIVRQNAGFRGARASAVVYAARIPEGAKLIPWRESEAYRKVRDQEIERGPALTPLPVDNPEEEGCHSDTPVSERDPRGIRAGPLGCQSDTPGVSERDPSSSISSSTSPTATAVRERAAAVSVDNFDDPDPPVVDEPAPASPRPIDLPSLPGGVDPASLAIDDDRARRVVGEMLEVFAEAGYQRYAVATGRSIGVLANWARAGLTATDVREKLAEAEGVATTPINSPVRYLAARIGQLRPKRAPAAPATTTTAPAAARFPETDEARDARMQVLQSAGVRRREPESTEA